MVPAGEVLCLIPDANRPGKRDMTGAFLPEAMAFCRHFGQDPSICVRRFPASGIYERRRDAVEQALALRGKVHTLAMFCHGYRRGIQAGYTRAHAREFVDVMRTYMHRCGPRLILYACDTGRDLDGQRADDREPGPGGDHGFADRIRDVAERLKFPLEVTAHTTAGHTTWNPYVRRFEAGTGGHGGQWLVTPRSKLWRPWVRALKDGDNTLRFRMPFMTREQIANELTEPEPLVG